MRIGHPHTGRGERHGKLGHWHTDVTRDARTRSQTGWDASKSIFFPRARPRRTRGDPVTEAGALTATKRECLRQLCSLAPPAPEPTCWGYFVGTRNKDGPAPEVRRLTPAAAAMAHITINQYLQQVSFAWYPCLLATVVSPGALSDGSGGPETGVEDRRVCCMRRAVGLLKSCKCFPVGQRRI